jgi:Outer membrane protein beta-barrel domain
MRARIAVLAFLLTALLAAGSTSARAQEGKFLVGLEVGLFEPLGFYDSYDAVYGDSLAPVGARFEWAILPRFAVAISGTAMSSDGEQVAILPGEPPVPTGIETSFDLTYLHLTAAWRIHPEGPWSGYVGGGPTWASFEESSEFEAFSESNVGGHVAAGIRRSFGRFVLGAEALYATIPDAIGEAGAAAAFGEDDAGGLAATLLLGYAF